MSRILQHIKPDLGNPSEDGQLPFKKCFHQIGFYACGAAISFICSNGSNLLAYSFVGSSGDVVEQAAHSLGYSIGNILVLTLGLGLVNGMDTLCPLVIGIGYKQGCFTYLFQAFLILTCLIPIIGPIIGFSFFWLKLCTPNGAVAARTAYYLLSTAPSLFFMSYFEAVRKFLIYHRSNTSHTLISIFSIPCQVLFLWIFVYRCKWGAIGAAAARSFTWFIVLIIAASYVWYQREAFGWSTYMQGNEFIKNTDSFVNSGKTPPCINETFQSENLTQHTINADMVHTPKYVKKKGYPGNNDAAIVAEIEGSEMQVVQARKSLSFQIIKDQSNASLSLPEDSRPLEIQSDSKFLVNRPGQLRTVGHEPILNTSLSATSKLTDIELTSPVHSNSKLCISVHDDDRVLIHNNSGNTKALLTFYDHWWQGIPLYLRIAVPSTFLCVVEWVAFEAQIIGAAYLGEDEVTALAATVSLGALIFFFHLSIGVVATGEVGRALGSRRPKDALKLTEAAMFIAFISSTIFMIVYLAFRYQLATLFSHSPEVQRLLNSNLLWQGLITVIDAAHAVLGGVFKAHNLQWYGCIFDFLCLLGVMNVMGFSLAFTTNVKGRGFLIGTFVGMAVCLTAYVLFLFVWVDWEKRSDMLSQKKK